MPAGRAPNLHMVHYSGQPLCVACRTCGHRATLQHEQIDAHSGNMKEVRKLRLKCSLCQAKDFEMFIVHKEADVLFFLNEAPPDYFRPKASKEGAEF
jgi:ferredoxin